MIVYWASVGGGAALGAVLTALVYRLISPPKERHERKCARLKGELKLRCPHGEFKLRDEKIAWMSWFISPSGTLMWGCERCGQLVNTEMQVDESMQRQMDSLNVATQNDAVKQWAARYQKNRAHCSKLINRLVKAGCNPSAPDSADRQAPTTG